MNRPLHIWLVFVGCLALLLGAMSWVTVHSLQVEKERQATAHEAERQERVRLALWRLDFQASTLVIRENARPPEDFRAFHAPEGFVDKNFKDVAQGDVLVPSPLLGEIPEGVLLHFQMSTSGQLSSPQTPAGKERIEAVARFVDEDVLLRASHRLAQLRQMLQKHGATDALKQLKPDRGLAVKSISNGQMLLQWNCSPLNLPTTNGQTLTITALGDNNNSFRSTSKQEISSSTENALRNRAVEAQKNATLPNLSQLPALKGKTGTGMLRLQEKKEDYPSKSTKKSSQPKEPVPSMASILQEESSNLLPSPPAGTDRTFPLVASPPQPTSAPAPPEAKPLQGFWIEDALLLTREAKLDGQTMVQGVWLDWKKLREQWRSEVQDLFPNAQLDRAPNAGATLRPEDDPLRLASLPVRLVPGTVPLAPLAFWSPLRGSLAVAWGCVVLAIAAVGLMLHGIISLSERRAAFVSAVTHELRTPLTTFRLYSEMLADGMVKDEEQRQTYLSTLEAEAGRLSHLVENVLAYSRIERGSARTQTDHISIQEILDRVLPRLRQRATQSNMEIALEVDEKDGRTKMRVDVAALEQILFNLVDNACKYAAPRAADRTIHVQAVTRGPIAMLRVRDHGGGIAPHERRSIFRPFHKSADAAAHSAPGVGLGLALCARLSKALGGRLSLENMSGSGASFVLELPCDSAMR